MNQTPHRHDVHLDLGAYKPSITYGDTRIRLYHTHPSARRVTRLARRAIKRHDQGSLRADVKTKMEKRTEKRRDKRREKTNRAYEAVEKVRSSDWYMDSSERMDDLHGEALRMDMRRRPYTWSQPFEDSGPGRSGAVHVQPAKSTGIYAMNHTFGLIDPPGDDLLHLRSNIDLPS